MSTTQQQIVKLNVSGRIFLVPLDILKISPFFTGMLEDCSYDGEEVMIYRSPLLFEYVLTYMYDLAYLYPLEAEGEIDYYCLPLRTIEASPSPSPPPQRRLYKRSARSPSRKTYR